MGDWRYCEECGIGQAKVDFEDLRNLGWGDVKVQCVRCGLSRNDDTPEERIYILTEEIATLKAIINELMERLEALS